MFWHHVRNSESHFIVTVIIVAIIFILLHNFHMKPELFLLPYILKVFSGKLAISLPLKE